MAGGMAALAAAAGGLAVLVTLTADRLDHRAARGPRRRAGRRPALGRAALACRAPRRGHRPRRGQDRAAAARPGAAARRADRAGRPVDDARGPRDEACATSACAGASIAFPYALFTGAVAVASRTPVAASSLWQAVMHAGSCSRCWPAGSARRAAWRRGARWPAAAAAVAFGDSRHGGRAGGARRVRRAARRRRRSPCHLRRLQGGGGASSPGVGGSALLLLASLSYLPNSVIWAIAYMLGPGFSFGVGTAVSPSGSALGAVPAFPMLAALPVGVAGRVPALARLLRARRCRTWRARWPG